MTVNDPRPALAAMLAARLAPAAVALALPDSRLFVRRHSIAFIRRPGLACPREGGGAGAQPRFWPQLRWLNLFSTGCGGMGSHGWTPASPLGGGDRRGPG